MASVSVTNTSTTMFFGLHYTDNVAYPNLHHDALQCNIDVMYRTYSIAGLMINIWKTEVLCWPLGLVINFLLLWTVLFSTCRTDDELQYRTHQVSKAFVQLCGHVFLNRNLSTFTKASVSNTVYLFILLYGSESWTPLWKSYTSS